MSPTETASISISLLRLLLASLFLFISLSFSSLSISPSLSLFPPFLIVVAGFPCEIDHRFGADCFGRFSKNCFFFFLSFLKVCLGVFTGCFCLLCHDFFILLLVLWGRVCVCVCLCVCWGVGGGGMCRLLAFLEGRCFWRVRCPVHSSSIELVFRFELIGAVQDW